MFITTDTINASNILSVKRHLSGLNIRPATLKTRLSVISKFLTIFFKLRVTIFSAVRWPSVRLQAQQSILLLFIWNEMNSDWWQYRCASIYWTKSQWSTKRHWFLLSYFYQYPQMICIHMLVISVVERCFRLGLNYLIPLKRKVTLYKLLYKLYT